MSNKAQLGGFVKESATGRVGEVVTLHAGDFLPYKVLFSDGGEPPADWFKEAAVENAAKPAAAAPKPTPPVASKLAAATAPRTIQKKSVDVPTAKPAITAKLQLSYGSQGKLNLAYQQPAPLCGKLHLSYSGKLNLAYKQASPVKAKAVASEPITGKLVLAYGATGRLNLGYKQASITGKLVLAYGATAKLNLGYKKVDVKSAPQAEGSMFDDVPVAPPDAILSLASRFKDDKFAQKVNLGIGAYRTEQGKPWPLPSVLAAQMVVATDKSEDKEYVPIDGKPEYKKPVQQLIFSDDAIASGTIATAQSLSGTGSLALIGQFLSNFCGAKIIHVPAPTWGNHHAIFKRAGLTTKDYTYYKPSTRGFDFEGMIAGMKDMKAGEVILLHAVAQNPTGVDPTPDQWQVIVDTCKARKLLVLLDNAYQGYASGSLAQDGLSMTLFEKSGQEFFVAQSFAKNFGLYGERIGYIHVKCETKEITAAVLSQLKILIRQAYSSPPRHGAAIVYNLLSSPALKKQWLGELKFMSDRILQMRDALRSAIEAKGTPGTWNHITDQIGMFSYTGLTTTQVECMVNEKHIYMTKDGRISVAGLNPGNVAYVAACIDQVVRA